VISNLHSEGNPGPVWWHQLHHLRGSLDEPLTKLIVINLSGVITDPDDRTITLSLYKTGSMKFSQPSGDCVHIPYQTKTYAIAKPEKNARKPA